MWIELFSIMIELKQWEHCLQSETIRTGMTYSLDDFNELYKTKNIWRFSLFKLKKKKFDKKIKISLGSNESVETVA